MKIKTRLHRSYSLISVIVLLITGLIIICTTQSRISSKLDKELTQTNLLVYKMVENVFDINRNFLLNNLNIFEKQIKTVSIDTTGLIESDAEHYITQLTDYISIKTFRINGRAVFEDINIVDGIAAITGGNVSILQIFDEGLLRISTNILRTDGSRATQIYYPNNNKITQTIRAGNIYIDKTFEMGQWYIVAYKPLVVDGNIVGALQVGIKPDINTLRKHILDIQIGQTGIPFIVDTEGILVIDAEEENENVYHLPHIKTMIKAKNTGSLVYLEKEQRGFGKRKVIIAYQYLPDMEWIVASGSYLDEFYGELGFISWIIIVSIVSALLIIIFVSLKLAESLSEPIKQLTSCMSDIRGIEYDFSSFSMMEQVRDRISGIHIREDEIQLLASSFNKMIMELEDAHRQLISKHRRYRESELVNKVDEILLPDFEKLQDQDLLIGGVPREEAAGEYYDMSTGPDGQIWYLVGSTGEQNESAAVFMMMAQASLNSILNEIPDASAVEVVHMLNVYLACEVNNRINNDKPYQISIIVSSGSGWIQYAGLQSTLRVFRQKSPTCEQIPTHNHLVNEPDFCRIYGATFRLQEGDILVLGTDDYFCENNTQILTGTIFDNWNLGTEEITKLLCRENNPGSARGKSSIFLLKRTEPLKT